MARWTETTLCLLKEAFVCWKAHKAPKMGAALAYYTALSLAPLVLLTISVLGFVLESSAARQEIIDQFNALVGPQAGAMVESIIQQSATSDTGIWASIISFAILLLGASGVFGELQDSLNQLWDAPEPDRPFMQMIRDRAVSFAMVFSLGFLVLVSLALSAGIAAVSAFMKDRVPISPAIWEWANSGVTLVVVTLMFAALFRFLPDVRVNTRDVWFGAALTGILFVIGKLLIGFYIGQSATASAYGAAGSLIVVLIWVFYSAQIFFFGAALTRVSADRRCRRPPAAS